MYLVELLMMMIITNSMFVLTHDQSTACNDKYCLYYGGTVNGPNSHEEARTLCSQINSNGWLLEVYDEEVSQLVDKFFGNDTVLSDVLLNMYVVPNGWHLVNNKPFSDSVQTNNSNKSDMNSAYLSKTSNLNVELFPDYPNKNLPVLCQKISGNCSSVSGWTIRSNNSNNNNTTNNSSCYFQIKYNYAWYEAQNECMKMGGTLAVFDNVDLQDLNQTWVRNLGTSKYWVGLTKLQMKWQKSDSLVQFNKWKVPPMVSNSMNQCFALIRDNSNFWDYLPCNNTFRVICMEENSSKLTTSAPSLTSRNSTGTSSKYSTTNAAIGIAEAVENLSTQEKMGIGVAVGVVGCLLLMLLIFAIVICCLRMPCCKKKYASIYKITPKSIKSNDITITSSTSKLDKPKLKKKKIDTIRKPDVVKKNVIFAKTNIFDKIEEKNEENHEEKNDFDEDPGASNIYFNSDEIKGKSKAKTAQKNKGDGNNIINGNENNENRCDGRNKNKVDCDNISNKNSLPIGEKNIENDDINTTTSDNNNNDNNNNNNNNNNFNNSNNDNDVDDGNDDIYANSEEMNKQSIVAAVSNSSSGGDGSGGSSGRGSDSSGGGSGPVNDHNHNTTDENHDANEFDEVSIGANDEGGYMNKREMNLIKNKYLY